MVSWAQVGGAEDWGKGSEEGPWGRSLPRDHDYNNVEYGSYTFSRAMSTRKPCESTVLSQVSCYAQRSTDTNTKRTLDDPVDRDYCTWYLIESWWRMRALHTCCHACALCRACRIVPELCSISYDQPQRPKNSSIITEYGVVLHIKLLPGARQTAVPMNRSVKLAQGAFSLEITIVNESCRRGLSDCDH